MGTDFVVIDVETANPDLSSICQVGIASFCEGALVEAWESLVNPEDYFSPFNISIHGIDEISVRDAPNWCSVFPEVASRLEEMIVVSHTPFDRAALERACSRSNLAECGCKWLGSGSSIVHTTRSRTLAAPVCSCFGPLRSRASALRSGWYVFDIRFTRQGMPTTVADLIRSMSNDLEAQMDGYSERL